MSAAATGEEAVRPTRVSRDQHGGQGLASARFSGDVSAAPRQLIQQQLVVTPVGKVDGLPAFDSRRLPFELGGILALLDHHAALEAGANVVAASVPEALQKLIRREELEDARVLRLRRSRRREASLLQRVGNRSGGFRLDDQSSHFLAAGPTHERIDSFRNCGHGATRDVRLARRADSSNLHTRHRSPGEPDPLDGPACASLHLAPRPALQQRRGQDSTFELLIPICL